LAVVATPNEQFIEVITEYLTAAKICLFTRKPDGGLLGYSATLLLLCVTDAIGQRLTSKGRNTRLNVLNCSHFGLHLTKRQIKELAELYRHPLAHKGQMDLTVSLSADTTGEPFDFKAKPAVIRVPVFYSLVELAWMRLVAEGAFGTFPTPITGTSTLSAPGSGVA
jgi:hypothetical protein